MKHEAAREDFEDADIEWINDVITKQKDRKAPISIQTLRQEMASFHNRKGEHRNRDALASTWHGASRGVSQRHHQSQSSTSKATMKTTPQAPSNIPTMEELQTIMAAKQSYAKVKELVQDQAHSHPPQHSTTSMEPIAPNSLPTIEDLQSLMAQASAKSKDYPACHDDKCKSKPSVTAVGESEEHADSAKKTKKLLQSKSQHRSKTCSKAASLSPVRDFTDHHRQHREGTSKVDPLRRSHHHRHASSRSEADQPTQPKVLLHSVIESSRPKVREPSVGSTKSTHDRQDSKSPPMGIKSWGRNHHDPRNPSSVVSTGDKRGKLDANDPKIQGKPTISGDKDTKKETNTSRNHHHSTENRSASLGPKPRNRACSRGRSQVSSGAESGSIRSRGKVRSTSGDRRQQRLSCSDAVGKRRVLKGAKKEMTEDTHSQSGGHAVKPRAAVSFDQEYSDDVDHSPWMAASIMHFEDDWDNFRPKSTRPVLDADKAKKLAATDEKLWR